MNPQAHAPVASESEAYFTYSLPGLLPEGALLVFNPALGTLVYLDYDRDQHIPRLVAEQQFTPMEVCLLRPLLATYPDYCAYEVLHASFYRSSDSPPLDLRDPSVASSRKRLEAMRRQGQWHNEMRPVRNVLSRTRLKLHAFSLDVRSILETGCLLMPLRQRRQTELALNGKGE